MTGSVLLVDDDPGVLRLLGHCFQRRKLETFTAATGRQAAEVYDGQRPDVVLLDLDLPDMSGLDLLEHLCGNGATVIMLTGYGDIATAVRAMKAGAENFLSKPLDLDHLGPVVDRALEKARLKRAQVFRGERAADGPLEDLGQSGQMRELAAQIERVARAGRATVLLCGESGVGKGWVAERIHRLSPRNRGAFVDINCATLTGTFLESELFGHEKGAFTDAKTLKRGLFEIADGGTIFLDEICDLDRSLQPKVLKVLESHSFRRLGGTREINVDVRVISATNRDLQRAVDEGAFREDLFYRLNVMPLEIPPLRTRTRSDVAGLAQRILEQLQREFPQGPERMSPDALELLLRYDWPGNVRELRNVLERARILAGDVGALDPTHLPPEIRSGDSQARDEPLLSMEEVERRHIQRVLACCNGNRTRTAKVLRMSRATLYKKLELYGLARANRGSAD